MRIAPSLMAARWDLIGFAAIAVVAVSIRVLFAWQYTSHPLGQYPWVDEASYWTWARTIVAGQWMPVAPFYQDPLYPYSLACLMIPSGTSVSTLRLVSAGLGGLSPVLVAVVGRSALGRTEGFTAGGLMALYGPLIFVDGSLEKEGMATLCVASAIGATALWSFGPARWVGLLAAGSGFAWGVVALLRSNALLIVPLAVGWWIASTRGASLLGRRAVPIVCFLAGFAVAVAPAVVVNYQVSKPHEFLGTTWQVGPNFYIGNNPKATGRYASPPFVRANPAFEAADFATEASRRAGHRLSLGQINRYWLFQGINYWWETPGEAARLLVEKMLMVTNDREIPDNQDPVFVALVTAPALRGGIVGFGCLLPFAALSLGKTNPTPFLRFVQLATALGLISTAGFFVVGRYRVPWTPGLALLASVGLGDLIRRVRARDNRGLATRLGLVGLPCCLLAWWPPPGPPPQDWSTNLLKLGVANLRAGRIDAAIDAFDDARALDTKGAALIRSVCETQAVRDEFGKALKANARDGSMDSGEPTVAWRRARLLRQIPDRFTEALALLQGSLRSHPDDPNLRRELGLALIDRSANANGFEAAIEILRSLTRDGDRGAAIAFSMATNDASALPIEGQGRSGQARSVRLTLTRAIIAGRGK